MNTSSKLITLCLGTYSLIKKLEQFSFVQELIKAGNMETLRFTSRIEELEEVLINLKSGKYSYVIMDITKNILFMLVNGNYMRIFDELLKEISKIPNIILLNGKQIKASAREMLRDENTSKYIFYNDFLIHKSSINQLFRSFDGQIPLYDFKKAYIKGLIFKSNDMRYYEKTERLLTLCKDSTDYQLIKKSIGLQVFYCEKEAQYQLASLIPDTIAHTYLQSNISTDNLELLDNDPSLWKDLIKYYLTYVYSSENEKKDSIDDSIPSKYSSLLDTALWNVYMKIFGLDPSLFCTKASGFFEEIITRINSTPGFRVINYAKGDDWNAFINVFIEEIYKPSLTKFVLNDSIIIDEFERFFIIFQKYLSKVRKINIVYEKTTTSAGTIFELKVKDINNEKGLSLYEEYDSFVELMDLVISDSAKAAEILNNSNLTISQAEQLLSYFKIESMRLANDIKHRFETERLSLFQNLETQALEYTIDNERIISDNTGSGSTNQAALITNPTKVLNQQNFYGPVTIEKQIYGDYNYTDSESKLIKIFNTIAGGKDIKDCFDILRNPETDPPKKVKMRDKIKTWIVKNKDLIETTGTSIKTLVEIINACIPK